MFTLLILPAPCISDNCIKIKINLNFIFTLLFGASKGFMKDLKAFIKSFEAPQRSVQIKFSVKFFFLRQGIGTGRVKICLSIFLSMLKYF